MSIARRLAALDDALPLDPAIEAMIARVAAEDGFTAAETDELRQGVKQTARRYVGMTPAQMVAALAAETGQTEEAIRAEVARIAAVARP
jgi:hypothetical protein